MSMPLPDLDILVAVVELGSLTAAGEQLGLPRATLSRRLSRLEDQLGTRLVHRTTRRITPTEAGLMLYQRARPIIEAVAAATDAVRAGDGVPRGLLRVTVPPDSGLSGLFAAFLDAHPGVQLQVFATTRHVDLVAEGVDVALRAGTLRGASLVSRRLYRLRMIAVASRSYAEQRGLPADPSELVDHACLVRFEHGERPRRQWPLRDGSTVAVHARYASNDLRMLLGAVRIGAGIALLPQPAIAHALDTGALVAVLPDTLGPMREGGIWVVYPDRRLMPPRVRAFISFAVEWAQSHPFAALR